MIDQSDVCPPRYKDFTLFVLWSDLKVQTNLIKNTGIIPNKIHTNQYNSYSISKGDLGISETVKIIP